MDFWESLVIYGTSANSPLFPPTILFTTAILKMNEVPTNGQLRHGKIN